MTKRTRIPLPSTGGQFKLKGKKLEQTQTPTVPRKPGPKPQVEEVVKDDAQDAAEETGK